MRLLFLTIAVLFNVPSSAEETLTIGFNDAYLDTPIADFAETLMDEVYGKAELDHTFVYLPTIRSFDHLKKGKLDAMLAIEKSHPLAQNDEYAVIEPALFRAGGVVICLDAQQCTVEKSTANFGHVRGMQSAVNLCKVKQLKCLPLGEEIGVVRALNEKLIDAFITYDAHLASITHLFGGKTIHARVIKDISLEHFRLSKQNIKRLCFS